MTKIELSDVQRLILDTVFANHRGSIAETRVITRIQTKVALEDQEKAELQRQRVLHTLSPTLSAMIAPNDNVREYEFDSNEKEKMTIALQQWEGYNIADVEPVTHIMKALDKLPPKLKQGKRTFDLSLHLSQRLQLTIFLKQIFAGWEEASKWAQIAYHFVLTEDEMREINFRAQPTGMCSWNLSRIGDRTDKVVVSLTETQADMLLKRLHANDRWTPGDLVWIDSLLQQLEERADEGDGTDSLQSPVSDSVVN